jgi:hypothetical protein
MSRRFGQSGYVVKKGKQWHGGYYVDEKEGRRRVSVPLGAVNELTKTQAKLKLRQLLEAQGVNTDEHLARAISPVKTFAQEAEWWRTNKMSLFNCLSPHVRRRWANTLTNIWSHDSGITQLTMWMNGGCRNLSLP